MAKDEAPTLFQVNGPVGLATWKDYCYDLSGSDVYKDVESDDYVLKDGVIIVKSAKIRYNKIPRKTKTSSNKRRILL